MHAAKNLLDLEFEIVNVLNDICEPFMIFKVFDVILLEVFKLNVVLVLTLSFKSEAEQFQSEPRNDF